MKTILVIYTNTKMANSGYTKRYCFKTDNDVKLGDMLSSKAYDTPMQVVKILNKDYKYFNKVTGDMSNIYSNSNQYEIRSIKILAKDEIDIIMAVKL